MLSTLTSTDAPSQSQLFRFAAPGPEQTAFFTSRDDPLFYPITASTPAF
jgi:hypothetical protein